MKVQCCICGRAMTECKPGTEGDERVSHGICFVCAIRIYPDMGYSDYINGKIFEGLL
jgi:hypothetical protein